MIDKVTEQWDDILIHLKEEHEILDVSFRTWLLPLKPYSLEGKSLKILVPDPNMVSYVKKKYGFLLNVSIEEVTGIS